MFGCLARRWKVTNKDERLQEDLYSSTETITDAWYLDPVATTKRYAGFSPSLIRRGFCDVSSNGQTPLIEVRGDAPEGLCAKAESKTTSYLRLRNGEIREESSIRNSRIMSLSEETFEAKLFEPPTNYRQIPVYPSRFTMAQSDIRRSLTLMWYRLRLRQAR